MLFADTGDLNSMTVAMAALTTLGGTTAALFAYLAGRDKLRYDAKMVSLEARVTALSAENEERKAETTLCHEERERDRADHKSEMEQLWKMVGDRRVLDVGPPGGVEKRHPDRPRPYQ